VSKHVVWLDMTDATVRVTGRPLTELGLEGARVVYPDGTELPLLGFVMMPGDTVRSALERSFPNCKIVILL
jgi:hypothetical protein